MSCSTEERVHAIPDAGPNEDQRDAARVEQLRAELRDGESMTAFALRFALSHSAVSSAIIGFGSPSHVVELVGWPPSAVRD